jgi:hypothetical protein
MRFTNLTSESDEYLQAREELRLAESTSCNVVSGWPPQLPGLQHRLFLPSGV